MTPDRSNILSLIYLTYYGGMTPDRYTQSSLNQVIYLTYYGGMTPDRSNILSLYTQSSLNQVIYLTYYGGMTPDRSNILSLYTVITKPGYISDVLWRYDTRQIKHSLPYTQSSLNQVIYLTYYGGMTPDRSNLLSLYTVITKPGYISDVLWRYDTRQIKHSLPIHCHH